MKKIVLVEPAMISEENLLEAKRIFLKEGFELINYPTLPKSQEELASRICEAEIMITSNYPVRKEALEKAPNLKMISVAFTGFDHIDIEFCTQRKIIVSNAAGFSDTAVAELTISMILERLRKLSEMQVSVRSGSDKQGFLGSELSGKRVGVVGTGRIGRRVINLLLAFGAEVIAYSRTPHLDIERLGVRYTPLEELIQTSDIITLHVPLNSSTQHLIGEKQLKEMKPGALLINTARGGVVDSKALVKALNEGLITAAIDVFDSEPPLDKDHQILLTRNSLLLPHIAYATKEAIERRSRLAFENVSAFIKGTPVRVVNI